MALPVALPILRMVLYGRIVGPVFACLILVLLICVRILVGACETIPRDFDEACSVDGAT